MKGRAMSESINTAARERLEALVGEWTMEATPPGRPPWPGGGRVTFAWLEGVPLLIQHWHMELPEAPDAVAVIGCDGMNGTYYLLYTDERDVQRLFEMSLDAGVWKLWRSSRRSTRSSGTGSSSGSCSTSSTPGRSTSLHRSG